MSSNYFVVPLDPKAKQTYCGPTVLALLTGLTREEIHADVNRLKRKAGKKRNKTVCYRNGQYKTTRRVPWPLTAPVGGLSNGYLESLMTKYGLAPKKHTVPYKSLRRLVEDMGHFKQPIVVNVTGHYVLYFQGLVYDTFRKTGAPVAEHPFGGSRVKNCWIITKQKMKEEA